MTKDDDDWFDALAGRPAPGARADTALEAQLLRAAVRRVAPQPVPALTAQEEEALLRSLRRPPGLQAASRQACLGCARRRDRLLAWLRRFGLRGPALASAAAVLVAGWAWLPGGLPAPGAALDALRGGSEVDTQVVAVADPLSARNLLADRLTAGGALVTRHDRLGRHGLQAQLPQPVPDTLVTLLRAEGLTPPGSSELRVEFEARVR